MTSGHGEGSFLDPRRSVCVDQAVQQRSPLTTVVWAEEQPVFDPDWPSAAHFQRCCYRLRPSRFLHSTSGPATGSGCTWTPLPAPSVATEFSFFTQPAFGVLSSGFVFRWRSASRCSASIPLISASTAYSSPIHFRASSVRADGVRTMHIVLRRAWAQQAASVIRPSRYSSLNPAYASACSTPLNPARWVCGWMPSVGAVGEPHRRCQRWPGVAVITNIRPQPPGLRLLVPGNSTRTGVSSAWFYRQSGHSPDASSSGDSSRHASTQPDSSERLQFHATATVYFRLTIQRCVLCILWGRTRAISPGRRYPAQWGAKARGLHDGITFCAGMFPVQSGSPGRRCASAPAVQRHPHQVTQRTTTLGQQEPAGRRRFHRGEWFGERFAGAGLTQSALYCRVIHPTGQRIALFSEAGSDRLPFVRYGGRLSRERLPKFIRRSLSSCACRWSISRSRSASFSSRARFSASCSARRCFSRRRMSSEEMSFISQHFTLFCDNRG